MPRLLMLLGAVLPLAACSGAPRAVDAATAHSQGERLYQMSCAACHGRGAQGDGPVAPLLKVPVPDLTRIAARRGGSFPERDIYRIVDGQADLAAHGDRYMPVWGYEFFGEEIDDEEAHAQATAKIDRLVHYLRSIQRGD
jgi:mono/diheme cytochrome c family protein